MIYSMSSNVEETVGPGVDLIDDGLLILNNHQANNKK
jgi:hypothetical protein